MDWIDSQNTYIWIFPVGRGSAAFVRTGLNQGIVLDMACGDLCDPASLIEENFLDRLSPYSAPEAFKEWPIAQAILSHPHVDHIAQCARLAEGERMQPALVTCPHHKEEGNEKLNWSRIENPEGTEDLIDSYKDLYEHRCPPLQTIQYTSEATIDGLEYGIFYVRPPICERLHPKDNNNYGNATSIMTYFRHGENSILFPGDITPEALEVVLRESEGLEKRYTIFSNDAPQEKWHRETTGQPTLEQLLIRHGLSVLVAPHHGLESCFPQGLYNVLGEEKPECVVISERRHKRINDGSVDKRYQSEAGSSGIIAEVDGRLEERRSLSTIQGYHILVVFPNDGDEVEIYADRDPGILLERIH